MLRPRLGARFALLAVVSLTLPTCSDFTGTFDPDDSASTDGATFDNLPSAGDADVFAAYTARSRWQKESLRYYVANFAPAISPARQKEIVAEALAAWAQVTPLTFDEVLTPGEADFLVGFGSDAHCDLYQLAGLTCPGGTDARFDGLGNLLAHAYYPGQGVLSGEAHFDQSETWVDSPFGGTSLLSVAMHEFGHTLGLDHSTDVSALMYPSYSSSDVKLELRADDIAGIQALYGTGGSAPPAPPPPPSQPPTIHPCASPVSGDADGDGVSDQIEVYQLGTNPAACDTDQDGLPDFEAAYGLNPLNPDTDGDGATDGTEVQQGSNPFVPDQGAVTPTVAGGYSGSDNFGSPIVVQVASDGSAQGVLRILYFGYPTDIALAGGIDASGRLLLLSWDYFFAYSADFVTGGLQGVFQTAAGAYGTWSAVKTSLSLTSEGPSMPASAAPTASSNRYQPPLGERTTPTFPVHQRVMWR